MFFHKAQECNILFNSPIWVPLPWCWWNIAFCNLLLLIWTGIFVFRTRRSPSLLRCSSRLFRLTIVRFCWIWLN
jgi:hypothetical protein